MMRPAAVAVALALALAVGSISRPSQVGEPLGEIPIDQPPTAIFIDLDGCIWEKDDYFWVLVRCLTPEQMRLFKR